MEAVPMAARGARRLSRSAGGHSPRRGGWRVALVAALATLAACGGDAPWSRAPTPALVLVDSVTLEENDSSYVGEPFDLVVRSDGTFLVSDVFTKRVLSFQRNGSFAGAIGREGKGPGEFTNPTWLALAGDTLLYVVNQSQIDTYNMATSGFVRSRRFEKKPFMLAVYNDLLYAGRPDSLHRTAVEFGRVEDRELGRVAPLLFPMHFQGMYNMFGQVAVAVNEQTVATAYAVTDHVYFTDRRTGRVLDSIAIPAVRRQGANSDRIQRYVKTPANQELAIEAVTGASLPMELHWLPSGEVSVVSEDWKVDRKGRFTGVKYLSVVDPRARTSCADAVVPGPTEPPTTVGFRGDTLFVLSQLTDEGDARTTIRAYRVDTRACRAAR